MTLTSGQTLAFYEILGPLGPLGAGGMGEVPLRGPDAEPVREADVERVSEVPILGAHTPTLRGDRLTPDGAHIVFDRTHQNSDVVVWNLEPREE